MEEKKKILFLISTLNNGGAEHVVSNLTLDLPENVEVELLLNSESKDDYPHKGKVTTLGFKPRKGFSLFYQAKAAIKRIQLLSRMKKENGYDAVISFMDSANIVNILTGNKYCKTVISERIMLSKTTKKSYKYIVGPLAKLLYKKADLVTTLSKGSTEDLIKRYDVPRDKAITIYNGYDVEGIRARMQDMSELPEALKEEKKGPWILSVGRLCYQKGQWHLIRAFKKVCEKHPDARLFICGRGAYEDYLKTVAQEAGLDKNVVFLGFCKNTFAIASRCDAFAFASLYEGLGNVMIEALACSLPIISTDYKAGCREIIAPDTDMDYELKEGVETAKYGIITPVPSGTEYKGSEPLEAAEEALGEAILKIAEDEELSAHYVEMAAERIEDFTKDEIVRQWMEAVFGK